MSGVSLPRIVAALHPALSSLAVAVLLLPATALTLDVVLAIPAPSGSATPLPSFADLDQWDVRRWLLAAFMTLPAAFIAGALAGRIRSGVRRAIAAMLTAWPVAVLSSAAAPSLLLILGFGDIRALDFCLTSCDYLLSPWIHPLDLPLLLIPGTLLGPLGFPHYFVTLVAGCTFWSWLAARRRGHAPNTENTLPERR